jgi:hypothetical protein
LDSLEIDIMFSFWAIYIGYNNRIYGKKYGIKSEVLLGTCWGTHWELENMLRITLGTSWWELDGNTLKTTKIAPPHPKEKNWDFQKHDGSP